jgi:hypothetical protein
MDETKKSLIRENPAVVVPLASTATDYLGNVIASAAFNEECLPQVQQQLQHSQQQQQQQQQLNTSSLALIPFADAEPEQRKLVFDSALQIVQSTAHSDIATICATIDQQHIVQATISAGIVGAALQKDVFPEIPPLTGTGAALPGAGERLAVASAHAAFSDSSFDMEKEWPIDNLALNQYVMLRTLAALKRNKESGVEGLEDEVDWDELEAMEDEYMSEEEDQHHGSDSDDYYEETSDEEGGAADASSATTHDQK